MTLSALKDSISVIVSNSLTGTWVLEDSSKPKNELVTVDYGGFDISYSYMDGLFAEGDFVINFYKQFDTEYLNHVEAVEGVSLAIAAAGIEAIDATVVRVEQPTVAEDTRTAYRRIGIRVPFKVALIEG